MMAVARSFLAFLAVLALMGAGAPGTLAHHASADHPTGTLAVPAAGSASIPIEGTQPGDTLQWTWATASAAPESLSARLVWMDSSGREHEFVPSPAGQTFGTFVAPEGFTGARLVWRNAGEGAAEVQWAYGASAPFWRRPDMFLPALIPVLFLVACYVVGRSIDKRALPSTPGPGDNQRRVRDGWHGQE